MTGRDTKPSPPLAFPRVDTNSLTSSHFYAIFIAMHLYSLFISYVVIVAEFVWGSHLEMSRETRLSVFC